MSSIIALMTDFGHLDPYVGMMKGVIIGIDPDAKIVDLSHEIVPGDVRSAAFALGMAVDYFPAGTIFLPIVDPGVGTSRLGIAVEIAGKIFVGPDNGILSWVLESGEMGSAVELTNEAFLLPKRSGTFHGRDIFAPVAGHISKGTKLKELGEPIQELVRLSIPKVSITPNALHGEVVYIDRFGNLLTNILNEDFLKWRGGIEEGTIRVNLGSNEVNDFGDSYGTVMQGHPIIVLGGEGVLEVAVNGGNAAESFGASLGTHLTAYRTGK